MTINLDLVSDGAPTSSLSLTVRGVALRGAQACVSLASVVLLAGALGAAGRGEYFLFLVVLAVLTRVADLGLSATGVVFSGRFPHAQAQVHRILLQLMVVGWLAAGLVLIVVTALLGWAVPWPASRSGLVMLILPLTLYEQLWTHLMVGMRRVVAMNLVQLGAGLVSLALIGIFVIGSGEGLDGALAVFALVALAKALVMLLIAVRVTRQPRATYDEHLRTRDLFWFGLRSYPQGLATQLWSRLPTIVLDATHGSAALGVFSIAQQSIEQLLIPAQSAQDAIYQRITALPREQATRAMNRCLRIFLLAMIPCALACAALAPWTFRTFFGQAFDGSATLFQILLISATATAVPALLSPYFFGQLQRPGLVSALTWTRVGVALLFSVPLAWQFAGTGLAVALVIADLTFAVLMLGMYVRCAGTRVKTVMLPRGDDLSLVFGHARALLQGLPLVMRI
jgi:O-antigen/teichoic acid export membrane protein